MCRFGNGHDILISSNCNVKTNYVDKCAYNLPTRWYLNGGQSQYKIKDIEVYKVKT